MDFLEFGVSYGALLSCLLQLVQDSHDGCSQLSIPLTGVSVSCCTPWGEGAGGMCCCATTASFPLGEKEGRRRRKEPTECPMTQLVPEWEGGGWISCEGACRWVMKWQFKPGKNLKGQPGIDAAINSPGLMFHWVAACWLNDLMEHTAGDAMGCGESNFKGHSTIHH